MAKAKAKTTISGDFSKAVLEKPFLAPAAKAGQGKKTCTSCGAVVGVRTRVCNCGFEFPAPKLKTKSAKPSDDSTDVLRFLLINGGPEAAIELVQAVKLDAVTDFVIRCGGVSEALAKIEAELTRMGIK